VRYPIISAATFEWQDASGRRHEAMGITRDIGRAGLFIETETVPLIGSLLQVRVTLPAPEKGAVALRLGGVGQVRHHQHWPGGGDGFGASVVWHLNTPKRAEVASVDSAETGWGTVGTA